MHFLLDFVQMFFLLTEQNLPDQNIQCLPEEILLFLENDYYFREQTKDYVRVLPYIERVYGLSKILPTSPLPVSILVSASAAFSKLYTESMIALIFFLPIQYNPCSSSAFVPCEEPKMLVPLKKMCLRSVFASYPVVAPHVTSVPPYFSKVS